jgi:hypothetical protein
VRNCNGFAFQSGHRTLVGMSGRWNNRCLLMA